MWIILGPRSQTRTRTRQIKVAAFTGIGLAIAGLIGGLSIMKDQDTRIVVPATAYAPLLETIAKGESNGNYNAYFGNPANAEVQFTKMPVGDVLKWQDEYVRQGSYSSAVGRYQFVRPTLAGLVRQLDIPPDSLFDEALQDRLAVTLLERRGSVAFVEKVLTRDQFAANLAQEWAALPKVTGDNPEESYYARDGVNKSRISIAEVYRALAGLEISRL